MNNVFWHNGQIDSNSRESHKGHKGACLWFTGLSGSGKSTIASELEKELFSKNIHTYILDGDNIRHGLNNDLTFSYEDRKENIRRIGEVSKLFVDAGIIVLTAFISPFKADREVVRKLLPKNKFIEVFVDCELSDCEERDPKGLYEKARKNEIKEFTGITSPYEPPINPELHLKNSKNDSIKNNVKLIISFLLKHNYI